MMENDRRPPSQQGDGDPSASEHLSEKGSGAVLPVDQKRSPFSLSTESEFFQSVEQERKTDEAQPEQEKEDDSPGHAGNDAEESPDKRPPPPPPTPADVTSPAKHTSRLPSFSALTSNLKYTTLQEAADAENMNLERRNSVDSHNDTDNDGKSSSTEQKERSPIKECDTSSANDTMTPSKLTDSDVMKKVTYDAATDQHNRSLGGSQGGYESLCADHEQPDGMAGNSGGSFTCCAWMPVRYLVIWLVFVGMVIINAMRTNVGVMVLTILDKESHKFNNKTGDIRDVPSVNWDTMMIGFVHAVFYIGYMFTNIPGAYLTTRLPSHTLFGGCIFVSCLLNLTLPVAIEMAGYQVTITIRFIQGMSEGLLYPACYGILRHWSTPPERGRLGSLVFTGAYIGPAVGFPLAGIITDYWGWEYSYYVNGGLGVLYVFFWAWLSEEKPSHHKMISAEELTFIEDLQGSERIDYEGMKIPWGNILTSLPVASLCLCHFARNWVFILMLTNEPFYLNTFKFTISQNGVFSALPHVIKVSAALVSGYIADFVLTRKLLNTTYTRKLLTSGFGMQALFFGLLTVTSDGATAVVFLTLALGFGGLVVSGWQLNHYDLSARHASVLVGVTSTVGNFASIAAPVVAGAFTESKSQASWNKVWYITAGITGFACLSFLVFGSGERQHWSTPTDTTQLVIKQDKRRRQHQHRVKPTKAGATPAVFSYSQLREEGKESGHVLTGHVPNYGSQQTTPPASASSAAESENGMTSSKKNNT